MSASIGISHLLTIFVNAMRIVLAIYIPAFLEKTKLQGLCGTPEQLHTAIGVCVYFTSLLAVYHIAEAIFSKTASKCLSPVFWYFFIVLGIPFLNRSYRQDGGKFGQYALLVTSVCMVILFTTMLLKRGYHFMKKQHP